jgi:hypothetical protein
VEGDFSEIRQEFIANSSPIASMRPSCNFRRGIEEPRFLREV